ncbi:alpha-hydroxy acid oxidase [Nocardioides sp. W7]|uniref:alpha-hydroxy acid oxidase n=1 Tax=Nocardioides sp. W7 TaxID=2931390 RepID=UPI001FD4C322|nr:alpha-hydroxy acid oxidase [Nocardioides sp. W7]
MTSDVRWLAELEDRARAVLPAPVLGYVLQGAGDGITASEATEAWRRVRLLPHVMRDVTELDLGVSLLGERVDVPWGVAPTTWQGAVHPDGELAMARATAAAGGLMVVSSNAGTPFDQLAETGVDWWLQVYLPADRTLAEPLLARAVAAGARAVVLTVDTPVVPARQHDGNAAWDGADSGLLRVNFDDGYDHESGADKATDLGPHDLDWLSERTGLPVVVKGVLRPDDARRCVQAGARAVWVSNHGGRQLDRAVATVDALPAVVAEVGGAAEVYVDGGLRSGLDIVTATALGADAVFLGRSPLLALVEGERGVARLHRLLRDQVTEALRLTGCRSLADTRGILATEPQNTH